MRARLARPEVLRHAASRAADLELLLRAKAVLLPGLKVTLQDEGGKNKNEWHYSGGLTAYLQERLDGADGYVSPIFVGESYACAEDVHSSPRARAPRGRWRGPKPAAKANRS